MTGLYLGLMSGTSMDGIDAVLASDDAGPRVLGHIHHPFSPALRETLMALNASGSDELHRAAQAANAVAMGYAAAISALLVQTGKS
ncbi:MAG: anhydro-N-acetylmuramic acid kinase, partial [Burkholderiales bacterium]